MLTRRQGLSLLGGGAVCALTVAGDLFAAQQEPIEGSPFAHRTVVERARELAGGAYAEAAGTLPETLARLTYDQYRDIRFRPSQALLADGPAGYRLQLFHPGFLFSNPVQINVVRDARASRVAFSRSAFDYGANRFDDDLPADLGFAGLRVHYPLNEAKVLDELIVFQGASYFRFLSPGQNYGLSARGLAIDTGLHSGEEFPMFREFWVEAPESDGAPLVIHALLDSPSTSGAYLFTVTPDETTTVDVEVTLFPRQAIRKLGIAPLTSMYLHGEDRLRTFDDFRPEVHDSDGLLMATGAGEWIWRPLVNPFALATNAFSDQDPKGFGLFQRDRDFTSYQDLEAHYERRPSYWVAAKGQWGSGHVELFQIPSDSETNDNIVAFWVPSEAIAAGAEYRFAYRLSAVRSAASLHAGARVTATRIASPKIPGTNDEPEPGARRFILDFEGGRIGYFKDDLANVVIDATASSGRVTPGHLVINAETGGLRAVFDFVPDGKAPADLRAFLRHGDDALSETWSLSWPVPGS